MLIPEEDYIRIASIIKSTATGLGYERIPSTFYATAGALMLDFHYGIRSFPIFGAFLVLVNKERNAVYGGFDSSMKDIFVPCPESYHGLTATESHLIDFMAPFYNEGISEMLTGPDFKQKETGDMVDIPSKMFQKRIEEKKRTLENEGDFIYYFDEDFDRMIRERDVLNQDVFGFLSIVDKWFVRPPEKVRSPIITQKDRRYEYIEYRLKGAW